MIGWQVIFHSIILNLSLPIVLNHEYLGQKYSNYLHLLQEVKPQEMSLKSVEDVKVWQQLNHVLRCSFDMNYRHRF